MKIKPMHDRVFVLKEDEVQISTGGSFIPEIDKDMY